MTVSPPLDPRIAAWLRMAGWLTKLGVYPTMAKMSSVPLTRRKSSRPPRWLTRPLPHDIRIDDLPASELGLPATVRTYRPAVPLDRSPIVLFMHGGGFVNGGLDAMQLLCAQVAAGAHVMVASVDYPLAPEHPFPAAVDVCYETLCWLAENGRALGGDSAHIAVMGDSAGGNLAAALTLLARRHARPAVSRQILLYPVLDATLSTPRMTSEAAARREECDAFYTYYADGADRTDELISPLLAGDLSGLPPALIVTADHDSFRDDGALYASRLRESGVPVRYTNYLGMPHGFLSMPRLCRAAPQAVAEIVGELDQHPRGGEAPG